MTAALAIGVLALPEPAPTLAPEVAANIAATGVGNPITAVLLAFRAIDTLLEAIVLLFALIGVWSLAPDRVWGGRPGPRYQRRSRRHPRLPRARAAADRHHRRRSTSSGSAPTIPAASSRAPRSSRRCGCWSMMAGLADAPPISRSWLRVALVAGPLVFIAIGVAGVATAGRVPRLPATASRSR